MVRHPLFCYTACCTLRNFAATVARSLEHQIELCVDSSSRGGVGCRGTRLRLSDLACAFVAGQFRADLTKKTSTVYFVNKETARKRRLRSRDAGDTFAGVVLFSGRDFGVPLAYDVAGAVFWLNSPVLGYCF